MGIALRLVDAAGTTETHELPDFESITVSPVFCEEGAIEFSYPVDGVNFAQIANRDEFRVNVYLDGILYPEMEALWIKDADGDDVAETGVWKFTGWMGNGKLSEAVVYPEGWPSYNADDPAQKYANNTPGYFFTKLVVNEAQARGALAAMWLDNVAASNATNGAAWTRLITMELKPGTDYLEVFGDLYESEICEFLVAGNRLRVYNYGEAGTDRTVGASPLVFRSGRDLFDSPRKLTSRERANSLLVEGAEGVYIERKDTAAIAARRRVEEVYNYSETDNAGVLDSYAGVELQRRSFGAFEVAHGLALADSASPRPLRDFDVGDWVYSDTRAGLQRLRVKQWTISQDAEGIVSGSVILNEAFRGRVSRVHRRLRKVVRGKVKTGTSKKSPVRMPPEAADNVAPAAPTNVTGFGTPYIDNDQYFARITASWAQVSTNSDGTAMTDFSHYLVSYRQPNISAGWSASMNAGMSTTMTWFPTAPSQTTEVRVAAVDKWGNVSAWSTAASFTTPGDTDAPPVPSPPVLDSYLGLMRIRWDGTFAAGATQPYDFNRVEVHVGTTSTFTPTDATLQDALRAPGYALARGTYGTTLYARLIAVDELGNRSAPTTGVAGTVAKVAEGDVASVNVGQLVAGTVNAIMVNAGRFTTALTGARTEFNSAGFYRFDASGNTLVAIDGAGNLLTGTFRTALTGRRIEMVSGGTAGDINLIAPDGKRGFVRSYTQSTGQEAIQFGMQIDTSAIANILWNRLTINSSSNGEYATLRSGTCEFIYDSATPNNGSFRVYETTNRGESSSDVRIFSHSTGNWLYHPIAGSFRVYDRSDSSGVERLRFYVFDTGTTQYIPITGGYDVWFRNSDASTFRRLRIEKDSTYFNWEAAGAGYLRFYEGASGTTRQSPKIAFVDASGTGAIMRGGWSSANGSRMEVRTIVDGGFEKIFASAFDVQSTRKVKTRIQDLGDARAIAQKLRVRSYRRKDVEVTDGVPELGLVAEEAPEELKTPDGEGINLMSATALALALAQQALAEIDQLKNGASK